MSHPRIISLSLLAVLLMATIQSGSAADKLNVLLIVADDLRDSTGCYGNTQVHTPNMDRLAQRGVRFERAYVQYPVCNASRTSFLTGLRCEQTRVVDNTTMFRSAMPDVVTLPQALRQNGWHTASYGKIFHVGEVMGQIRGNWNDLGKSWDEETHDLSGDPAHAKLIAELKDRLAKIGPYKILNDASPNGKKKSKRDRAGAEHSEEPESNNYADSKTDATGVDKLETK